ncbi:hypothetical protein PR001_g13159 [Phytophthora rubi]|uniref:Uncharacterized protein n=2 Tax=Phytophthora rubi TaxID=129364 RepID=A0A6A3KQ27_9STRA|nr:hypothetical protein PR002_g16092 [Phytophthora rubi]KAE9022364.1 hypothetical protein PR001_g13159 [Phytophthora rubi]
MDLRSRTATEGSAYRDMGRDHSSDEDYEPARKKTRTGRKGRADEEHKAGEGGDEGRGDSAKGTESR